MRINKRVMFIISSGELPDGRVDKKDEKNKHEVNKRPSTVETTYLTM